jgi:hypothetical protein
MAVSGGVVERYGAGGLIIGCTVSEAITAGNVVNVSGDFEVSQGDAGETLLKGIALQTSTGVATDVIDVLFPGCKVIDLVASGAIPAGTAVESAASGAVSAVAGDCDPHLILGYAIAAAADSVVPVVIL